MVRVCETERASLIHAAQLRRDDGANAQAVCCSDQKHCCPQGTKCDVAHGRCTRGEISIGWFAKTPALGGAPAAPAASIKCKDGSMCPEQSTCCKLANKAYGCCPVPRVSGERVASCRRLR